MFRLPLNCSLLAPGCFRRMIWSPRTTARRKSGRPAARRKRNSEMMLQGMLPALLDE
jgi:hypothetical protein